MTLSFRILSSACHEQGARGLCKSVPEIVEIQICDVVESFEPRIWSGGSAMAVPEREWWNNMDEVVAQAFFAMIDPRTSVHQQSDPDEPN
jgi:hypothetical protein